MFNGSTLHQANLRTNANHCKQQLHAHAAGWTDSSAAAVQCNAWSEQQTIT
jgi:hypothetical protein